MKNEMYKDYTTSLALQKRNEPALYQIVVLNDDFTPMEFVISLLERIFYLGRLTATKIMLEAHVSGKAACGTFTKDVAETKLHAVCEFARTHEHPLTCTMEIAG